jgi:hypothetical protein
MKCKYNFIVTLNLRQQKTSKFEGLEVVLIILVLIFSTNLNLEFS